ncbi:hypothetical protein QBC39DRAFT_134888 [Podospora conica]|nr:hypothetical protein QBC39DRAFT_134888 [Schizothecium conicum]
MSPIRLEESSLAKPTNTLDSALRDDDPSAPTVQPPPRARKRPIRTYGKRSAQNREEEDTHPQKKQKLEEPEPKVAQPQPQPTPPPPKVSEREPPKRGSIMSYFKPVPPSSRAPSPEPPAPPAERALTPPPSSPISFGKARKRRLTTRPKIDGDDILTRRGGSEEQDEQGNGGESRDGDQTERDQNPASPSKSESGAVSAEGTSGTFSRSSILTGEEARKKGKSGKRQPKERVQMTLSLAINPGPGFTICKDCGILFNPLNEKDRKEHKKRHAAHVRAKLKDQAVAQAG